MEGSISDDFSLELLLENLYEACINSSCSSKIRPENGDEGAADSWGLEDDTEYISRGVIPTL